MDHAATRTVRLTPLRVNFDVSEMDLDLSPLRASVRAQGSSSKRKGGGALWERINH